MKKIRMLIELGIMIGAIIVILPASLICMILPTKIVDEGNAKNLIYNN